MATDPSFLGTSSSLSPWAGPYVTEMLGRGAAVADMPYQAYMGPLTAGPSALQSQAFSGLGSLAVPPAAQTTFTPASFTGGAIPQGPGGDGSGYGQPSDGALGSIMAWRPPPKDLAESLGRAPTNIPYGQPSDGGLGGMMTPAVMVDTPDGKMSLAESLGRVPTGEFQRADIPTRDLPRVGAPQKDLMQQYMSPYLQGALEPQIAEAQRQAEIQRVQNAGRLSKAGAFGGGRQAIMESEGQRNLLRNLADITGRGYQTAFEQARQQFNTEQNLGLQAAQQAGQYGLQALGAQLGAGGTQRGIEQAGIAADIAQFEQERAYPYRQTQFMQSLLQGLPISTQQYQYAQPTGLESFAGGASGILSLLNNDVVKSILGLD